MNARALGFPALTVSIVLEGTLLARKDTRAPIKVRARARQSPYEEYIRVEQPADISCVALLLAPANVLRYSKAVAGASIVNLVLDVVTVNGLGMGIMGAALATTVAQLCGMFYLMSQVTHQVVLRETTG